MPRFSTFSDLPVTSGNPGQVKSTPNEHSFYTPGDPVSFGPQSQMPGTPVVQPTIRPIIPNFVHSPYVNNGNRSQASSLQGNSMFFNPNGNWSMPGTPASVNHHTNARPGNPANMHEHSNRGNQAGSPAHNTPRNATSHVAGNTGTPVSNQQNPNMTHAGNTGTPVNRTPNNENQNSNPPEPTNNNGSNSNRNDPPNEQPRNDPPSRGTSPRRTPTPPRPEGNDGRRNRDAERRRRRSYDDDTEDEDLIASGDMAYGG
jgi:hypothetical protein